MEQCVISGGRTFQNWHTEELKLSIMCIAGSFVSQFCEGMKPATARFCSCSICSDLHVHAYACTTECERPPFLLVLHPNPKPAALNWNCPLA